MGLTIFCIDGKGIFMWIRETPNGKYRYIESYVCPLTGKRKEVSKVYVGKSKVIQNKARQALAMEIQKRLDPSSYYEGLSFETVAYEWLATTRASVKPSTVANRIDYIQRLVKYLPKEVLLHKVSESILVELQNKLLLECGYANNTVKETMGTLKRIYRYAQQKGYIVDIGNIERYKFRGKPLSVKDIEKYRGKYLTHSELKACIRQLEVIDKKVAVICLFQAFTGLRIGELLALREEDYSKQEKVICVSGSIDNVTKERGTPKNLNSVRNIALDDLCCNILERAIKENQALKVANGEGFNPQNFIFITSGGRPVETQYINKKLKLVTVPGKRLTTHIFRHTHITLLADAGLDVKTIMDRVGHSDSSTTLEIYTHVTGNMQNRAVAVLEKIGDNFK